MKFHLLKISALIFAFLGMFLVVAFQGCSPHNEQSTSNEPNLEQMKVEISDLDNEIDQLALKNLSCKTEKDCLSIEAGFKVCGGPRKFVVTSFHNDTVRLHALIENLTELEREYNLSDQLVSTCALVLPPQLQCIAETCQAAPSTTIQGY